MADRTIGLSRKELEREARWLLRDPPDDPRQLVRLMSAVVVTLIERNNERVAADLERRAQDDRSGDF